MLLHLSVSCLMLWASTEANRGVPVSEALPVDYFCFKRLNNTHQFGCSSEYKGNVGVVHVVRSADDVDYIATKGPQSNYMAVLDDISLSVETLDKFKESGRVAGVLVTRTNKKPEAFSTDDTCPNRYSSFYSGDESCRKNDIPGNKVSSALLRDYPFPIFYVNQTLTDQVVTCFDKFNKDTQNDSLFKKRKCSLKMYAPMNAAVNSEVCLRRTRLMLSYFIPPTHFCDPLESKNVFALLEASEPAQETVIIAARLDSFSLFSGLAPGADSAVSGIVTLLSIADTLTKMKSSTKRNKNVLFALFNGEAFDYIGSSRAVLDLLDGQFQFKLTMDNITGFIELNQVLLTEDSEKTWFAHIDSEQYNDSNMRKKLDPILKSLKETGHVKEFIDADLPASSARRFLQVKRRDLSIVVLTNFEKNFTNPYYNSIFDSYGMRLNDIPKQAEKLQNLVASVSNTVLKMIAQPGSNPGTVNVDKKLIDDLLVCYLTNSSCPRFHAVVNEKIKDSLLRTTPYPLYVSVDSSRGTTSGSTALSYLSLAHLMGRVVENITTMDDCSELQYKSSYLNYTWMYGDNPTELKPGVCVEHLATMSEASSPAFDTENSTADGYSTWTESVWNQPEMSLFIQASGQSQWTALVLGIGISVTSLVLSVLIYRKSDEIFEDQNVATEAAPPVAC